MYLTWKQLRINSQAKLARDLQASWKCPTEQQFSDKTCSFTFCCQERQSVGVSMIVPVWPHQPPILAKRNWWRPYWTGRGLLDQEVSRELQADASPVKLNVTTTMGKNTAVNSERVSDLLARGYSSATVVKVQTQDSRSANCLNIADGKTAKHWLSQILNKLPPPQLWSWSPPAPRLSCSDSQY